MQQYFWVLFDKKDRVFYQDSQMGITDNMLFAEHYKSYHEANEELKYFKNNKWTVKKVTVTLEE